MHRWRLAVRIAVVCLALGPAAGRADAAWTPLGPGGSNVFALVVAPTTPPTLYAGIWGGGVFRSTTGGASWEAANTGLTNLRVWALTLDPASATTLYAGTYGGGVFVLRPTWIGLYRAGTWYLDRNGNGVWDGCPAECATSGGLPGEIPVVGKW